MKIHKFKDPKTGGSWIMILGCPLPEKHTLCDAQTAQTGPSFAQCAECEHQIGENFELLGAEGHYDAARIFPERLLCRKLDLTDMISLLMDE